MRRWLPTPSAPRLATFFHSVSEFTLTVTPGRPFSVKLLVADVSVAMSPSARAPSRNDTLLVLSVPLAMLPSASTFTPGSRSAAVPPSQRVLLSVVTVRLPSLKLAAVPLVTMPSNSAWAFAVLALNMGPLGCTLVAASVPQGVPAAPLQLLPLTSTTRPFQLPAGMSLVVAAVV